MTVGELKDKLKDIPDDVIVLSNDLDDTCKQFDSIVLDYFVYRPDKRSYALGIEVMNKLLADHLNTNNEEEIDLDFWHKVIILK